MEVTNFCALIFLLHHVIFSFATEDNSTCGPGLTTPGYTYPKGDITLEYGSPLEILCILNADSKHNASSLEFFVDNVTVPQSALSIYNRTTLRLYIERPPVTSQSMYYCHLKIDDSNRANKTKYSKDGFKLIKDSTKLAGAKKSSSIICLNLVRVGFKPAEVRNFTCVSHNWENLNCSWVPPYNPVVTQYHLGFYLKNNRKTVWSCPSGKKLNQHYCLWNSSSEPIYRQAYEYYYLVLSATNKLGNLTTKYTINHYANVIPNKAVNLSLVEATSNSLAISWDLPLPLKIFPPGIVNRVIYQSKWDPQTYWEIIDPQLPNKNSSWAYNIAGLKYAHTLYDIRVLMRSTLAEDVGNKWSEPATITLRTKPTVPGKPPKTDIGSFESSYSAGSDTRDIILYWQQIPRYMENGDTFEYKIILVEEFIDDRMVIKNLTEIAPSEITKTYAKYKGLSLNRYRFTIVSSNSEGYSITKSYIEIPNIEQSPSEPVSFSKIAFDNGVYELSWNIARNIRSYSIFWCDNKQDRPFDCKGFLNWTKVYVDEESRRCDSSGCPLYQKNVTLPVDKVYQFALSANMETSSSGMVWASCTVLPEPANGKLRNAWISRTAATFVELSWKLECFDRSRIINRFLITYCPISTPQNYSSCKEPPQNMTIKGGPDTSRAKVPSLKPYTTYTFYVSAVSDNWEGGIKSDALLTTTLEGAPDTGPLNLHATKSTNMSVSLSWSPPTSLNGVLKYYEVHCCGNITQQVESKSNIVNATFNNLRSFELYHFKVYACTVTCSQNSSSISVKTKVGRPGEIDPPRVELNSTTRSINIFWRKPHDSRGNIDFYNVKIESDKIKDADGGKTVIIERVDGTSFSYKWINPECEEYHVQIQPVNIADDGSMLEGTWSQVSNSNCVFKDRVFAGFLWYLIFVGVLAAIAICISMGYFTRCMWLKCKAMQNVGVKLPPQLELNIVYEKSQFTSDQPMSNHVGSTQLKSLDSSDIPPPDQELLLEKKDKDEFNESSVEDNEDGNVDRESSGCGSGHDSVSSSITAGTHITDSGTEADERPPSPDSPVFLNSPRNRSSDLRQRNISFNCGVGEGLNRLASPAGVPMGYVTVQSAPRGYVSHVPHWAQNTASKGYVTVSALPSPSTKTTMYCKVGLKPGPIKSKDDINVPKHDSFLNSEGGVDQ